MDPVARLGLCFEITIILIALLLRLIREITRMWAQQASDEPAAGKLMSISVCPVCGGRLESHLMTRHLMVTHEMDGYEAAELVEAMRSESTQAEE